MADAPKYPDFSQPSIMNPKYGPRIAQMFGPLIREMQRQQQFAGAFGVSPRQAIKPTPEETQRMLNVGLAFGGADITKEQREAWEAENAEFRKKSAYGKTSAATFPSGTRVTWRPPHAKDLSTKYTHQTWPGTVVEPDPKTSGYTDPQYLKAMDPDRVAVQLEGSPIWLWRHRDDLEVLPTEDFPLGTKVRVSPEWGNLASHGEVTAPPKSASPSPGPDYVWVDVEPDPHTEPPRFGEPHMYGIKEYAGGSWGAWIKRSELAKKVKK